MSHKEHFTVAGRKFALDKERVEGRLKTIKPQPIDLVYVHVGQKDFPVKQALAESVPGLIKSQFTTQDAVRVMGKVGFDPKEKKKKKDE